MGGDRARPLTDRGRRAATTIGTWLAERDWRPGLALVSEARRARETWALLAPHLGEVESLFVPDLYGAEASTILRVLRREGRGGTVLIIGHNPGLAEFASRLVAAPPAHPRWAKHPTGATTLIEFDLPAWERVDWGSGRLVNFVVPKDLRTEIG